MMNKRFRQTRRGPAELHGTVPRLEDLDRRWQELEKTLKSVAGWAAGIGDGLATSGDETDG